MIICLNEGFDISLALVKYRLNLQDFAALALLPGQEVLDLLELLLRMLVIVHVVGGSTTI